MIKPPSAPLDSDLPPHFHNRTVDIADRLQSMIKTEQRSPYQCHDYLDNRRPLESDKYRCRRASAPSLLETESKVDVVSYSIVTPALRTKIVQWLYHCVDFLELSRECVAMAMSYVDRFMSSSRTRKSNTDAAAMVARAKQDTMMYQLVAFSSLFLAAKQYSSHIVRATIDACTLERISHNSYSSKEIVDTEKVILEGLDWRLCGPTPLSIAYDAIALLAKTMPAKLNKWDRVTSVLDFTRLQIELSVLDYDISVLCSPSTIALASILNSLELLDFTVQEKRSFSRNLRKNITSIQDDIFQSLQMQKTRKELHKVFDRQSNDVIDRVVLGMSTAKVATKEEDKNNKKTKNIRRSQSSSPNKSPVQVDSVIADVVKMKRSHSRHHHQGRRSSSYSNRRRKTDQVGVNPVLMTADKNSSVRGSRRVPLEP